MTSKSTILSVILLGLSINTNASVSGNASTPSGAIHERQTRPISSQYDFTLTNTTSLDQIYFIHAEICPSNHKCKTIDREIPLKAGESLSDGFSIETPVCYYQPGQYNVISILSIRGESNLYISRNGNINVV